MARLDVYRNPQGPGYLLDVQADLLGMLNTRMAVPLLPPSEAPKPAGRLNPVFEVDGATVVMVTQFMAAIPAAELRTPVASLLPVHTAVIDAIDMLLSGF